MREHSCGESRDPMSALPCPVVDALAAANQAYATICRFRRSEEARQVKHSQAGEDHVCFVDHREIEWRDGPTRRRASLASGEFPADQINPGRKEIRLVLSRLNVVHFVTQKFYFV